MKFKDQIPNFITLLNLISGSIAIILVFSGEMVFASWFIFLAALLDFFDGFAARLLHAKSEIGAQLDSLADVISFGLAPAVIMYQLILQSPDVSVVNIGGVPVLPFVSLVMVAAGAYRLARFNTDPGQSDEFKGLPIPANGLFVAALPLIMNQNNEIAGLNSILNNSYLLVALMLFLSWLMVSSLPMIALKFKNLKWHDNAYRFILIAAIPVLFVLFRFSAVPMLIILYIILSVISLSLKNKNS